MLTRFQTDHLQKVISSIFKKPCTLEWRKISVYDTIDYTQKAKNLEMFDMTYKLVLIKKIKSMKLKNVDCESPFE